MPLDLDKSINPDYEPVVTIDEKGKFCIKYVRRKK